MIEREFGIFPMTGMPPRLSAYPNAIDMEAPSPGEHNHAVQRHLLGCGDDRIAALERQQARVAESSPH